MQAAKKETPGAAALGLAGHPVELLRRARFAAKSAAKHLDEVMNEPSAEPMGHLRLAYEQLEQSREALKPLLRGQGEV